MPSRLRAVKGLLYPDAKSLDTVLKAGGLSKLSDEQRESVVLKRVEAGAWCDDVPEESRAGLLKRGHIEVVETSPAKKKAATK